MWGTNVSSKGSPVPSRCFGTSGFREGSIVSGTTLRRLCGTVPMPRDAVKTRRRLALIAIASVPSVTSVGRTRRDRKLPKFKCFGFKRLEKVLIDKIARRAHSHEKSTD